MLESLLSSGRSSSLSSSVEPMKHDVTGIGGSLRSPCWTPSSETPSSSSNESDIRRGQGTTSVRAQGAKLLVEVS